MHLLHMGSILYTIYILNGTVDIPQEVQQMYHMKYSRMYVAENTADVPQEVQMYVPQEVQQNKNSRMYHKINQCGSIRMLIGAVLSMSHRCCLVCESVIIEHRSSSPLTSCVKYDQYKNTYIISYKYIHTYIS